MVSVLLSPMKHLKWKNSHRGANRKIQFHLGKRERADKTMIEEGNKDGKEENVRQLGELSFCVACDFCALEW